MTEQLHFHFSLSGIGEGNGNPLQCSCLENPRDGGAWWAAVYGVTQSRTRLKRLRSSSSSWIIRKAREFQKNIYFSFINYAKSFDYVDQKNLYAGQEDPLEEEMATHANTLAWEIPRTEESGGVQPMGSQESQTRLSN